MLFLLPKLPLSFSKTKAEIYSLLILCRLNETNTQAVIQKGNIFFNKNQHPYYWLKYQDRIIDYASGQFFEAPEYRYFNLDKPSFHQELPYRFSPKYQPEENIALTQFLESDFYHENCCYWLRLKEYLNINKLTQNILTKKEQLEFEKRIDLLSLFDIVLPQIETKYLLKFDEWFEVFSPTFSPAFLQADRQYQRSIFEHYHKQNDNILYDIEKLQKMGFVNVGNKLVHQEKRERVINELRKQAVINFQIVK